VDCSDARAALWPPERPKLHASDVALAEDHVRDCEGCGAWLTQDRELLDVYERARLVRAPRAVRERVFDALAGARWDTRRLNEVGPAELTMPFGGYLRTWAWPAALVGMLLLVVVGTRQGVPPADDPDVFVQDYLRRAVGQDHIETSDASEVRRFLERELGLRFDPIQLAGLDLTRAEICLLEGRRGAMIVYKTGKSEITHYVVPREDAVRRAPALSTRSGASAADMPVVTWATPHVEQALMGEVSSDQLIQIAQQGSSFD
jgi:hypothetical protein